MTQKEGSQPTKVFRAGAVSASVWVKAVTANGRSMQQHQIRVQKRYRDDRSGEWKTTSYFRPEDMPRLALIANKVFEHVTLRESEGNSAPVESGG